MRQTASLDKPQLMPWPVFRLSALRVTQGWTLVTAPGTEDNAIVQTTRMGLKEQEATSPGPRARDLSYHGSFGPSWNLKEQEESQHPNQRHARLDTLDVCFVDPPGQEA